MYWFENMSGITDTFATHILTGEIVCDEEKKEFGHACKRLFLNNSDNQCPVNCSQTGKL